MRWLVLALVLVLPGCCWMSKRSCFPACPPREMVPVETPCELPPRLELEPFRRHTDGCPGDLICFDRDNAAALAKRLSDMRDWILETRKRCSPPASRPTTP
jgi:hypothetical protein